MKVRVLSLIVLSIFVLTPEKSFSQGKSIYLWEGRVNAGTSLFFGDGSDNNNIFEKTLEYDYRPSFGGSIRRRINSIFGARAQASYGVLAGARLADDVGFKANYVDLSAGIEVDLINIFKDNPYRPFSAYLFAGGGAMRHYTIRYQDAQSKNTDNEIGHKDRINAMGLAGFGFKYKINERIGINLETSVRNAFRDDLDAYITNSPTGVYGRSIGNNDQYNYTSIGISYAFGKNKSSKQERSTNSSNEYNIPEITTTEKIEKEEKPVEASSSDSGNSVNEDFRIVRSRYNTEIRYCIQILASKNREYISKDYSMKVKGISEINEAFHNGYKIYTTGNYASYGIAKAALNRIKPKISDAFIVAFTNNKRLNHLSEINPYVMDKKDVPAKGITYRVHIADSKDKPISILGIAFKYNLKESDILEEISRNSYIYTTRTFSSLETAFDYATKLKQMNNVEDAYLIKYIDGRQVQTAITRGN
jgi:hypothetical protein